MKEGADDYQRKQELTREKLVRSVRELTRGKLEKTVPPEIAASLKRATTAKPWRSAMRSHTRNWSSIEDSDCCEVEKRA